MTLSLEELAREASTCTRCRLAQGRTQVVFGVGHPDADVMFIGEGPGYYEDKQGEPFVGAAGQLLTQLPDEIEACRPYLEGTIENVRPRVMVTLGNFATRFILDKPVSISRVRGQRFDVDGRTVVPTFHPAAVLHGGGQAGPQMAALRTDFRTIQAILAEPRPEPVGAQEQLGLF